MRFMQYSQVVFGIVVKDESKSVACTTLRLLDGEKKAKREKRHNKEDSNLC
jgi:hypothetical protein